MTATLTQPKPSPRSGPDTHAAVVPDEFAYFARHGIRVETTATQGWILRADGAGSADGAVIACIEESENQYELIQVRGGFRWSIHDTILEALQQVVGR